MRVLLGTDGSLDARRATRWLRQLPLPSGTAIDIMTVTTLSAPPRDAESMAELRRRLRLRARRTAESAARTLRRRSSKLEILVADGDPASEIIRAAEDRRVDLVVLGARGLGSVKRILVGSTSSAAVRYAPCAVAVIRGRPRTPTRVLVGVDGSEVSRAALRFLWIYELIRDSRVSLLHVVPERRRVAPRNGSAAAERLLARMTAQFDDARHPIEQVVVHGDPARKIIEVAARTEADLVVLGARGRGALARALLGSVSEAVLYHLRRPLVIVRQR